MSNNLSVLRRIAASCFLNRGLLNVGAILLLLAGLFSTAVGQDQEGSESRNWFSIAQDSESLLQLTETDIKDLIDLAFIEDLPTELMDPLYFLALNRSEVVFPIVEARVLTETKATIQSREKIMRAVDLIAYVPTAKAAQSISKLTGVDSQLFGPAIDKFLGYSVGRANVYKIAYEVVASGVPKASEAAAAWVKKWVQQHGDSRHGYTEWAEEIVRREEHRQEGLIGIEPDPLLSLITTSQITNNLSKAVAKSKVQKSETLDNQVKTLN